MAYTAAHRWRWPLALLWLLWSPWAHAADGQIAWKTLRIAGADITYPAGYESFALRVASTWQDAERTLGRVLRPRSGRLQITIDDYGDGANGFATVMPFDHVHLQAYPPPPGSELGDHGDWLRALVFHEYMHVLHLGTVSDVPAVVNAVVGPALLPNTLLPRFLTEGLATWAETRHTGGDHGVAGRGGRVDSPVYLAQLRAAALGGTWPELSQLTGSPLQWPRAGGWYLFGSLLMDDLAQRHGDASTRHFVDAMGARLVPYGIQSLAREAWGVSLGRAWDDARRSFNARVRREVQERAGVDLGEEPSQSKDLVHATAVADGTPLTRDGEWRGRIRPWSDGLSAVVAHGPREGRLRYIERIWPDGRIDTVHTCQLDCDEPMVTADGAWLLFTETRRWQRLYLFRDLVAVRLNPDGRAEGPELRLTHGARLRSPALSPHGEIAAVLVAKGRTSIAQASLPDLLRAAEAGQPAPDWRIVVPPAPLGQTLDSPCWLPDLAYTQSYGDHRLLRRVHDGTVLRGHLWLGDVQESLAIAGDQDFRDVFATPRGQAEMLGPGTGLEQRTRTLTGITSATRVGDDVLAVRYGPRGFDVFRAPPHVRGSRRLALEVSEEPLALPYHPTTTQEFTQGRYNPLRSAWPRYWRPLLTATGDRLASEPGGLWLGALTGGHDALSHWRWALSGQLRSDGTDPIAAASLAITKWEPTFSLDAGYQQGFAYLRRSFSWYTTPTDRWGFVPKVSWQYARLRDTWQFDLGWRWVRSALRDDRYTLKFPYDPAGPIPIEPWTGWDAFIDAGVAYTWSATSPEAITTEKLHAGSARLSWSDRWTGGGRERVVFTGATAHRWPLGYRLVLETTANLALIPVPNDPAPGFGVRGIQPTPVSLLAGSGPTGITLRGLPVAPVMLAGNGLGWGTVQLHTPILDIGRGFDALPLTFARLRGLPFVDVASAFLPPPGAEGMTGTALSFGAELLLEWEAGYAIDGLLRLGAGHARFLGGPADPGHTGMWLLLGL